jgi:hypothetical protein
MAVVEWRNLIGGCEAEFFFYCPVVNGAPYEFGILLKIEIRAYYLWPILLFSGEKVSAIIDVVNGATVVKSGCSPFNILLKFILLRKLFNKEFLFKYC